MTECTHGPAYDPLCPVHGHLASIRRAVQDVFQNQQEETEMNDVENLKRQRDEAVEAHRKTLANLERLLDLVGDRSRCNRCGAEIWFVRHLKTGKLAPYTATALSHFADCPNAQEFRKR